MMDPFGVGQKGGKNMTNFEWMKGMGAEGLAWLLCEIKMDYELDNREFPGENDLEGWKEWLESECGEI